MGRPKSADGAELTEPAISPALKNRLKGVMGGVAETLPVGKKMRLPKARRKVTRSNSRCPPPSIPVPEKRLPAPAPIKPPLAWAPGIPPPNTLGNLSPINPDIIIYIRPIKNNII